MVSVDRAPQTCYSERRSTALYHGTFGTHTEACSLLATTFSVGLGWLVGWCCHVRVGQIGKINETLFSPLAHHSLLSSHDGEDKRTATRNAHLRGISYPQWSLSISTQLACGMISIIYFLFCSVLSSKYLLCRQILIVVSSMLRLIAPLYRVFFT